MNDLNEITDYEITNVQVVGDEEKLFTTDYNDDDVTDGHTECVHWENLCNNWFYSGW